MRGMQCSRCLRYRGSLECDAFPRGIPEDILTGMVDHGKAYAGDGGKRYNPIPGSELKKSEPGVEAVVENINKITAREEVAYRRVKDVLIRRGYVEDDFEEGGALYGYSVNELIDLAKVGA
jgi:hypothetical protein